MRNIFTKLMTGSMIVGAALAVSACGKSETANTTDTNLTEMNTMEPMDGTMNDVTAVDGANATMAADNAAVANVVDNSSSNTTENASNAM